MADWKSALENIAPLIQMVASKGNGHDAAFMQGFYDAKKEVEQEKRQKSQLTQQQAEKAFHYLSAAQDDLDKQTDPVQWQTRKNLYQSHYKTFGGDPREMEPLHFNDTGALAAKKKKAASLIDQLVKVHGPDIMQAHVMIDFDGQQVTPQDLQAIVGIQAKDATTHQPYVRPKPELKPSELPSLQREIVTRDGKTPEYGSFNPRDGKFYDQDGRVIPNAAPYERPPNEQRPKTPEEIRSLELDNNLKGLRATQAQLAIENAKNPKPKDGPRERFSVQQITLPDGKAGLLRVNMDTGEATRVSIPDQADAGKPSDTMRLSKAYLDRTVASDKTAADFEGGLLSLGSQLDVKLPTLLQSEAGQRYKQAKDEFINAALRRESGAAIQPSEYERYDKIYFAVPGNNAAVIKQKQEARRRVVAGFRTTSGAMGAAAPVDAVVPPPASSGPTLTYQDYLNRKKR